MVGSLGKTSMSLIVFLAVVLLFYASSFAPAYAQDSNCGDFGSQEEAQAELDADPSDPNGLDADDDGEACEDFDFGNGTGDGNENSDDVVSGDQSNSPGDDQQEDDQDCPVPEEVNTTIGSGDEQSPVFDVTGGSFRVTIDVEPTSQDASLAGVTVFVRTESDEPVTRIAAEGGGAETSIVNAGEDSFFLDILAANANYEITVEDCTGDTGNDGGSGNDDTGGDTDDDASNDTNDSNDDDASNDVIDDTIPDKDLPNTGGSFALAAGGAVFLSLYGALVAWRLKSRER